MTLHHGIDRATGEAVAWFFIGGKRFATRAHDTAQAKLELEAALAREVLRLDWRDEGDGWSVALKLEVDRIPIVDGAGTIVGEAEIPGR